MSLTLDDYLRIDGAAALEQWRAILCREPPRPGRRQERFAPLEVILCFGLFRVFDPRRFGGRNIHLLPEPARRLAATFRRSPGSLTSKMLNLSFDRVHGGRNEPELFLRLSNEPALFIGLYEVILKAARDLELDEAEVPDFVGLRSGAPLLGQDELQDLELGIVVREAAHDPKIAKLRGMLTQRDTERLAIQKARLGQHRFAIQVLSAYGQRCGFCGFSPEGLGAGGLLIASHIKPWAACDEPDERLDPKNGVAACPTHDRAFDGGLLTVNGGYNIHRARELEIRLADEVVDSFFGPKRVHERLAVCDLELAPDPKYLEYHKAKVFRSGA